MTFVMQTLLAAGIHLLEALFLIGMCGATIVILWSGVEDVEEIFKPDEPEKPVTEKQ
jgi:hypothetical protein